MTERVKVIAIHKHFRNRSFVMVAERADRGQYVVCADEMGMPWRIAKAEDLITVSYKYRGHGAYSLEVCAKSMGRDDQTLDPICETLWRKGWSRSIIRMHYLEYEPLWNVMDDWALRPIKSKWDGSRGKYLITEPPTSNSHSIYRPDWAIHVHLEDNGYIGVHVGVPEVYEADQLGKLLKTIKSLPNASEMRGVHPAMLATG